MRNGANMAAGGRGAVTKGSKRSRSTSSKSASSVDSSSRSKSRKSKKVVINLPLQVGDWIDALDCAGVWNVAKIISIPSASEVEVSYDGWGSEYDEIILINDGRVAPYHTYTWVVRSWVKYLNWPWWPALVTMRQAGTLEGMENLRAENRLFVDFADKRSFEKRHRFWVDKTKIMPWQDRLYENRARTTGADFELSYLITMESAASDVFPSFAEGTLCEQFADSVAHSVASTKKTMGHDLWVRQFATNRERHNLVHRYKETNDDDDTAEEDVAVLQTISSDESDDAKTPPKKKGKQTVGVQRKRKNDDADRKKSFMRVSHLLVVNDQIIDEDDSDGDHKRKPKRSSQTAPPTKAEPKEVVAPTRSRRSAAKDSEPVHVVDPPAARRKMSAKEKAPPAPAPVVIPTKENIKSEVIPKKEAAKQHATASRAGKGASKYLFPASAKGAVKEPKEVLDDDDLLEDVSPLPQSEPKKKWLECFSALIENNGGHGDSEVDDKGDVMEHIDDDDMNATSESSFLPLRPVDSSEENSESGSLVWLPGPDADEENMKIPVAPKTLSPMQTRKKPHVLSLNPDADPNPTKARKPLKSLVDQRISAAAAALKEFEEQEEAEKQGNTRAQDKKTKVTKKSKRTSLHRQSLHNATDAQGLQPPVNGASTVHSSTTPGAEAAVVQKARAAARKTVYVANAKDEPIAVDASVGNGDALLLSHDTAAINTAGARVSQTASYTAQVRVPAKMDTVKHEKLDPVTNKLRTRAHDPVWSSSENFSLRNWVQETQFQSYVGRRTKHPTRR